MSKHMRAQIYSHEGKAYLVLHHDHIEHSIYEADKLLGYKDFFIKDYEEMRRFLHAEFMDISQREFENRYGTYHPGTALAKEMQQKFFLKKLNVDRLSIYENEIFDDKNIINIF